MRSPLGSLAESLASFINRAPAPHTQGQSRGWAGFMSGAGATGSASSQGVMEAYGHNATVFPIVNGLAQDTSAVEWCLHRTKNMRSRTTCERCGEEGVTMAPDNHPAWKLWTKPNGFQSGQEFREAAQQHIDLAGETFWMVEKEAMGNIPTALWLRWPHEMWEVPDEDEFLLGWLTQGKGGTKVSLELDEVIHTKMPNPANPYRGLGPVQAAMWHLGYQKQAMEWNNAFFRNGVRLSGLIGFSDEAGDTDVQKTIKMFREQHTGPGNQHRVAVLNKGAKWQSMQYSHDDMQFQEMYQLSERVIRMAFRYPEFMLGEPAGQYSAKEADPFYMSKSIKPRLDRLKGTLNTKLLPMYGALGEGYAFAYHNPVPEDQELKNATRESSAKTFQMYMTVPGMDPEYAAQQAGIPAPQLKEVQQMESSQRVAEKKEEEVAA